MPEILPSSIVSFSSEDKEYPASNLLKASGFNKWKCANPGEKNATVEFQLPQAERINQIDIGNEGSAFVEVLVRRTGADSDSYQVLLPSSSFMSPMEARSRTGQNRVRIFKADRLARSLVDEKWDRVRVVCSQPFVRNETYGLAFIRFYSVESDAEAEAATSAKPKQKTLAGFVIRDDAEEKEEEEASGLSLFSKKKNEKSEDEEEEAAPSAGPSSIATQIRSASKVAEKELAKVREEKEKKKPPAAAAPVKKRSSEEDSEGSDQPTAKKPKVKRQESSESKSSSSADHSEKKAAKKAPAATPTPFNALMRGVIFCMSGYENPLRSQLRDKAQAMGAKYRSNWDRECTHLICAFVDTPKYRSVTGKGRIVRAKWIEECHRRRALQPWRDFRLGRAPSPPGSDSEKKARRRASGRPTLRESSDEEEEDEEDEDDEVLPKRKARAAPKARRDDDVSDDEIVGGTSDSDSEAELRRRKQQRLRQKRKRKHGSDDESEEEWRPGKDDRKEASDSDPDAEIEENSGEDDSDSDWAASQKKKKKKKPEKKKPRSPKKRRSFTVDDDEDSEEEILPKKNRATASSSRAAASSPPPPPPPKGVEKSPKKAAGKPPAKLPTKSKSSLLSGSDSGSDGGWAPVRRKKGSAGDGGSSRTPSPSKAKDRVGEKEKEKASSDSPEVRAGDLPDLFPDTTFFFYGGFPEDTERVLRRVVTAYGGKLAPYMSESVKFVITSSKWDENFDDALAENSSLLFVRPQWLFECDRRRKFVPYQKFQVVG